MRNKTRGKIKCDKLPLRSSTSGWSNCSVLSNQFVRWLSLISKTTTLTVETFLTGIIYTILVRGISTNHIYLHPGLLLLSRLVQMYSLINTRYFCSLLPSWPVSPKNRDHTWTPLLRFPDLRLLTCSEVQKDTKWENYRHGLPLLLRR